ncbi:hypothetical protein F5H01DRAFT_377023 [Linnemannia elongata]|nr:hypothetical protein F5H01DRAFT_377023 [Linnemannia elongata]
MNPFSVVTYCQANLPSLPSLSSLPYFYHSEKKTSKNRKKQQKKSLANIAIPPSSSPSTTLNPPSPPDNSSNTAGSMRSSSASISTSSPSSYSSPRHAIRRNNSMSSVQSSPSVYDTKPTTTSSGSLGRVAGRVSMDSYDRASFLSSSAAALPGRTYTSSSLSYSSSSASSSLSSSPTAPIPSRSRHKKSSSSPPELFSPPLGPVSTLSSSSSSNTSTPSLTSLASIPTIVLENEVEPLDLQQPDVPHSSKHHRHHQHHSHNHHNHQHHEHSPHQHHRRPSSEETAPIAPPTPPLTSFFFGRGSSNSVSNTPVSTPPASPALHAARTNPSAAPSPSTTPPSSPSPSFLATWQGRLPSIPRPSPMTPFRAARKVVTSVTSVGTGLLPSKEQLGSIPVAGRILKHPVMDSTLTYIASKTTHRGGKGAESKPITPEDAPYLKLNRKLIDQSITLAGLAIEKEDLSKTMDDEAADDAFELYLAAIATLMHSLPIETCDPLRREAFQSQLRGFLDEHQLDVVTTTSTAGTVPAATTATKNSPDAAGAKQRRRLRRRRHREYREQARSLIHQYSPAPPATSAAPATAIVNPISSRRSSAPSSLPTPQSIPLVTQQASSTSSTTPSSHRRKRRHRRRRGDSRHHSDDTPTLGDTIISTAIESAIRLKQSPIPDVLKTCFRASRVILSKVDEKFHLQEKAWQLSKQSIEKAIELDEQYAIHEVVTETFFATVTGLVKAGIAYKETPSYGSLRAAAASAPLIEPKSTQGPALLMATPPPSVASGSELSRSQNPQAILPKKLAPMLSFPWRRHSVIEEEKEGSRSDGEDQNDDDEDDEEEDSAGESFNSEDASSSCFTTSEDGEEGDQVGESDSDSSYLPRRRGSHRRHSSTAPYTDQVRQRLDMLMALRGVASYMVGAK